MPDYNTNLAVASLAAQIVSSYVSHHDILPEAIPGIIQAVFGALTSVVKEETLPVVAPMLTPAVPIKKSVFPDYIICLEDGKKLKLLKRHLDTAFNMSPESYRAKWGLPDNYPMVAPNYAKQRSDLAKNIGFGHFGRPPDVEPDAPVVRLPGASKRQAKVGKAS